MITNSIIMGVTVAVDIITSLLTRTPIYVFDDAIHHNESLYQPFAYGDVFLREVNRDALKTIVHIWPMEKTVILGMMDRRLPYGNDAINLIRTHGYRAVVRNVGGLAVVADEGVLNFSFILPKQPSEKLSIQTIYEFMYVFIQRMFPKAKDQIKHFTVENSYCPGDYDLSISGKKFAGIAQRRFKNGISVSIYLSVCGNQEQRGQLIRSFYDEGLKSETTKFNFPLVDPFVMANLSDLLNESLTVVDVRQRLLDTLVAINSNIQTLELSDELKKEYDAFHLKMIERNKKI